MTRQKELSASQTLRASIEGLQISISELNGAVLEALALESGEDLVGVRKVFKKFKEQDQTNSGQKLSLLFTEIFSKTRDYFSAQGIDAKLFSEEGDLRGYLRKNLGEKIDDQGVSTYSQIDGKTYLELLTLIENMIDFISMVAIRADKDDLSDEQRIELMQEHMTRLRMSEDELNCIAGSSARFEILTNQLKPGLLSIIYRQASAAATEPLKMVGPGLEIHTPLFLKMLLGIVDENTAYNQDHRVVGLKKRITVQNAWQAITTYYQNFNDDFIEAIWKKLEGLLDDKGNIFGIKFDDLFKDKNFQEANGRFKKILEELGIVWEQEQPIVKFINEDQSGWESPQEIIQMIMGALIKKYPVLKPVRPTQKLKPLLKPLEQISSADPKNLADILKSESIGIDLKIIALQALYVASQPFSDRDDSNFLLEDTLSKIVFSDKKDYPQTQAEFARRSVEILKGLKQSIPQDQHFKIDYLQSRISEYPPRDMSSFWLVIDDYYNNPDPIFRNKEHFLPKEKEALFAIAAGYGYEKSALGLGLSLRKETTLTQLCYCAASRGIVRVINKYLQNRTKKEVITLYEDALDKSNPKLIKIILKKCDKSIVLEFQEKTMQALKTALVEGDLEFLNIFFDCLDDEKLKIQFLDELLNYAFLNHPKLIKNVLDFYSTDEKKLEAIKPEFFDNIDTCSLDIIKNLFINCGSDKNRQNLLKRTYKLPVGGYELPVFDALYQRAFLSQDVELITAIVRSCDEASLDTIMRTGRFINANFLNSALASNNAQLINVFFVINDRREEFKLDFLKNSNLYLYQAARYESSQVIEAILNYCDTDEVRLEALNTDLQLNDPQMNKGTLFETVVREKLGSLNILFNKCGGDKNKMVLLQRKYKTSSTMFHHLATTFVPKTAVTLFKSFDNQNKLILLQMEVASSGSGAQLTVLEDIVKSFLDKKQFKDCQWFIKEILGVCDFSFRIELLKSVVARIDTPDQDEEVIKIGGILIKQILPDGNIKNTKRLLETIVSQSPQGGIDLSTDRMITAIVRNCQHDFYRMELFDKAMENIANADLSIAEAWEHVVGIILQNLQMTKDNFFKMESTKEDASKGKTILHDFAQKGMFDQMRVLRDNGAPIDLREKGESRGFLLKNKNKATPIGVALNKALTMPNMEDNLWIILKLIKREDISDEGSKIVRELKEFQEKVMVPHPDLANIVTAYVASLESPDPTTEQRSRVGTSSLLQASSSPPSRSSP
ncbi:MAG: hypothetical protein V4612_07400 [Pseudomonadota bacterium]